MSKSGNSSSAVSEYWRSIIFALYPLHKVTDSCWRSWRLANFRGKPFLTVVLSAMDPKIDRAYGDQTPKVSHTRGIKSPPLSYYICPGIGCPCKTHLHQRSTAISHKLAQNVVNK